MTEVAGWPRKTREFHNHHFDSTIWNDFSFRDGRDVVWSMYNHHANAKQPCRGTTC